MKTTNPEIPQVTIITPSYNQAPFIEKTILSVLQQTYPNLEYIIVDGASTDGTRDIIRKYEHQIDFWISEPDQGQTDAINKGFARANGSILAWINSDDTYEPNAVAEAVEYLQAHQEVGLVYGDANFIDKDNRVIGQFNAQQTTLKRLQRGGVYIPQQSAFFRAELWRQVGPLDPTFYFAMDYDLWVRLARITEIKYLPKLWANFRLHGGAKTIADDARCWPEMLKVHRRDGGSVFSAIYLRYFARTVLAPILRMRRKRSYSRGK